MRGLPVPLLIALAAAVVVGLLVAVIALTRSGRGEGSPLPPEIIGLCDLMGLTPGTGRWTPPSCVGEYEGVRVAVVTGARARAADHAVFNSLEVLVDTGLHAGLPTTDIPTTGLEARVPEGMVLFGGASLLKGAGRDLAIRSRWPDGWQTLYLVGAPVGDATPEKVRETTLRMLEVRKALRGES